MGSIGNQKQAEKMKALILVIELATMTAIGATIGWQAPHWHFGTANRGEVSSVDSLSKIILFEARSLAFRAETCLAAAQTLAAQSQMTANPKRSARKEQHGFEIYFPDSQMMREFLKLKQENQ